MVRKNFGFYVRPHFRSHPQSDVTLGYPKFDRVNPIVDWSYTDVWSFLRDFHLSYCDLYDQGYTSIGNKLNTNANPLLFDAENNTYKPAYLLTDFTAERLGRIGRKASVNNAVSDNEEKVVLFKN